MTAGKKALTPEVLGAWLIKGSRDVYPVDELVRTVFLTVTGWSLHPTYRTDLIKPNQPVLFWISGQDDENPAGIYGQGYTTGRAEVDVADQRWVQESERGAPKLFMPLELDPVERPVLRSDLVEHPELSELEVLRMPAGRNPSFVSREHLELLKRDFPQITVS